MGREISQEAEIGKPLKYLSIIIATGLFTGYLPVAPATFSCAISIVIWYFILPFRAAYIVLGLLLFVLGLLVSGRLEKDWGKDPRRVVVDEYATLLLPLYFTPRAILPLAIVFLLFRFFDIVKPPPIRMLERLRGGWGIMLDDLLAAGYTTLIVFLLRSFGLIFA